MVWTFCADDASTPAGLVFPRATVAPLALTSCHGIAVVDVVTRVAFFGPPGTYATWFTRTRGPVSGLYTSGAAPPLSETLSTQNCHGPLPPPSWKATWPWAVSVEAVNVYVYV